VQGIPIAIEELGSGIPVLVLHGWHGDRAYMKADLEPAFFSSPYPWRRIYVDLPGHGLTPAPEWLETQAQMVSVLVEDEQWIASTLVEQSSAAALALGGASASDVRNS
jgi:pimeloyl-ACP methyl ester carboxylesterase